MVTWGISSGQSGQAPYLVQYLPDSVHVEFGAVRYTPGYPVEGQSNCAVVSTTLGSTVIDNIAWNPKLFTFYYASGISFYSFDIPLTAFGSGGLAISWKIIDLDTGEVKYSRDTTIQKFPYTPPAGTPKGKIVDITGFPASAKPGDILNGLVTFSNIGTATGTLRLMLSGVTITNWPLAVGAQLGAQVSFTMPSTTATLVFQVAHESSVGADDWMSNIDDTRNGIKLDTSGGEPTEPTVSGTILLGIVLLPFALLGITAVILKEKKK